MRPMKEIAERLRLTRYPARWDALAEEMPEPDDAFLSEAWIRGCAFPLGDELADVLAGAAAVRENPPLRDYTVLLAAAMRDRAQFCSELREIVFPVPAPGEDALGYDLAPCLALLTQGEASVERMRARTVPEDVIAATLDNTRECLRVFKARWGRPGYDMHYFGWSQGFLDGRILQIGSLQFEAAPRFGRSLVLPDRTIGPDDPVIHVHIPEGADISHEGRHAAYGRARRVFEKSFPEMAFRGFACHSWLMDPNLAALLPGSRIAAFQGEFIRLPERDGGDAVYEYVFIGDEPTPRGMSERTRLQRALKKWYLEGHTIDEMRGFMPF